MARNFITLFVIGWMMVVIVGYAKKVKVFSKPKHSTIDSLYIIIHKKDSIIKTWENHAIRMKRIVGVSDTTINWSYKDKVINPIDTQKTIKK